MDTFYRDNRLRRACGRSGLALAVLVLAGAPLALAADGADVDWWQSGRAALGERVSMAANNAHAKNVILFIGDGLGISTITAARIYDGQRRGLAGEEHVQAYEQFPHVALIKTYNTNQQVPDSAGTATAMTAGVKTKAGLINVSDAVDRGDCAASMAHKVRTIGEYAAARGLGVGVVTTTRLTHATPASVYAHTPERNWERDANMPEEVRLAGCRDIATQLVEFSAGGGIDVALGGGAREFLGTELGGARAQPKDDLVARWLARAKRAAYVTTADQLMAIDPAATGPVLGLFSPSHMTFSIEKAADSTEPSLAQMTARAIELLGHQEKGYFLMVEGGRIDHGHHQGRAEKALAEAQEFDRAVAVAAAMTDPANTLLLVTADHSHTLTIGGYPTRGNDILGLVVQNAPNGQPKPAPELALDDIPYTTLGYYNGPGATLQRNAPQTGPVVTQQAAVPTAMELPDGRRFAVETHAGEDVALFARGPRAHLFGGVLEQHVIFHLIAHAYGWDLPAQH